MTLTIKTALVILSLVCLGAAAFGVPAGRLSLVAAGLLLWELSGLV